MARASEQWFNKSVSLFSEEQCYLPCPPERDTATHTHLKVLLLHAVNEAAKPAGLGGASQGQGGIIPQAAFFAVADLFEVLTTQAQTGSTGRYSKQTQ